MSFHAAHRSTNATILYSAVPMQCSSPTTALPQDAIDGISTCVGASLTPGGSVIYLSFKGDESGNVIVLNYVTATVVSQATVAVIPIGPAAIVDTKSGGSLFVASSVSHLLQGYRFVQPNVLPSFTADLSNATGSTPLFSVAYNPATQITYFLSTYNLYSVNAAGVTEYLEEFSFVSIQTPPVFVGPFLVFLDSYYTTVYYFQTETNVLGLVALDTLDAHKPVVAFGSGIVVFSTSESIAGYYLDLTNPNIIVGILADSSRETNGAALVVDDVLIINTGGSSLSGYNVSGVPTFDTPLFNVTTAQDKLYAVKSAPTAYAGAAYFVAQTMNASANAIFSVTASGVVREVGLLRENSGSDMKLLTVKFSTLFREPVLYVIGDQNVTAYTLAGKLIYAYASELTISTWSSPASVLDNGAVWFYTTGAFNLLNLYGQLAWTYNTTFNSYPAQTDGGNNIFFSDGTYAIGVDIETGGVTSLSTYGIGSVRGFAVTTTANPETNASTTLVVGATDTEVVFANQVKY